MKHKWLSILISIAIALSVWGLIPLPKASASTATEITIERFVYDGQVPTTEGDEYVKICNISGSSIILGGANPWRIGDEENSAGSTTEGMYNLQDTLAADSCFIIASNANGYNSIRGSLPDYEMNPTQAGWTDNSSVPNLSEVNTGNWILANGGDNITLWKFVGAAYVQHDEVAYGTTALRYSEVGLSAGQISCGSSNTNCALVRNSLTTDTDNMASDFNNTSAPNAITLRQIDARTAELPLAALILAFGLLVAVGGILALRRQRA